MKHTLILIILFLLAACGSNPNKVMAVKVGDELYKPDPAAAMALDTGTKENIICERRIVTGSNRKQKVCTTETQKETERRDAERYMDRASEAHVKSITPKPR